MAHTVVCTFRVRPECEAEFRELLAAHWPTLDRLDLVDPADPPQRLRGEEDGRPVYVEIFTWKEGAARAAHEHPEVAQVWERMGALVEARDAGPKWSFPHFERLGET